MRKKSIITILFAAVGMSAIAQESSLQSGCAQFKSRISALAKTTVADTLEDAYDVHYVHFDIGATNTTTAITGIVTTRASVVSTQLNTYAFELNSGFTIDSVKLDGQLAAPVASGTVVKANFAQPVLQNHSFTAQVFYHGSPVTATPFSSVGLMNEQSPTWGTHVTFTMCEPYEARDWWPCKQSLTDKIDSADIWITVPSALKAGSNGILQQVTSIGPSQSRYEWKLSSPIDYYLLSIAVAPYVDYTYYIHFNATDSMPVQNYVYNNPQTLPFFQSQIDSVGDMILYFSDLFGRYPFWREKYGHCMAPLGGGMEHQTMTTLGFFNTTLTAHELTHQWFGDNVSCETWSDIWLNEGFATYGEYLYVAHFRGATQAFDYMKDIHNNVMSQPAGSVYVNDTTDEDRIFSERLTYKKGGSVVHTLRFILNDDNKFFQMLQDYQQQFAGYTANTSGLEYFAEQQYGATLDTFFQQWVYGEGYPRYSATWNQLQDTVYIKLHQTTTAPSSVTVFSLPLEFKLISSAGDTTVRVYNDQATQTYFFKWNKTVDGVLIDPNDWIVNADLGTSKDVTLSAETLSPSSVQVYPNPATDHWAVSANEKLYLELYDLNGRKIWSGDKAEEATIIPSGKLSPGVYMLKINTQRGNTIRKLVKQ